MSHALLFQGFHDFHRYEPLADRPQAHRSVVPEAFKTIHAGPDHMINMSPPGGAVVDPAVPEYAVHLVLSTPPLLQVGFNRPPRWLTMSPGVITVRRKCRRLMTTSVWWRAGARLF